jgi:hypothetical protein
VIDWGDVCLGDADFDLAVISMFFGADFLTRLLRHLPDRDPDTVVTKARFFTTLRWAQDLLFDIERADLDAVEESLQGLRDHVALCAG